MNHLITATEDEVAGLASILAKQAEFNMRWRRRECVNLIPSEQPTSAYVDRLVTSEPAARYNEHNRATAQPPNAPHVRYYQGTDFITEKEEDLKLALRAFFGCSRVEPRVISGQMANDTVYDALMQFRNSQRTTGETDPARCAIVHSLKDGGHLSAQPMGALKNYLASDTWTGKPALRHLILYLAAKANKGSISHDMPA